jgi:hypothetical protein
MKKLLILSDEVSVYTFLAASSLGSGQPTNGRRAHGSTQTQGERARMRVSVDSEKKGDFCRFHVLHTLSGQPPMGRGYLGQP